jgi:disulfide oxidoreductase YuzD
MTEEATQRAAASKPIRITIFGHTDREVCLISGCGSEVTSSQAADEVRHALQAWFGGRVAVRHYDLSEPALADRFGDLLTGAQERNLPFPLTAIDGDIVFAGPVTVEAVIRKLAEYSTRP